MSYRDACERCHSPLGGLDEAYVCSFDCTYCPPCTAAVAPACPNCGGELVRRARRAPDRSSLATPSRAAGSAGASAPMLGLEVVPIRLEDVEAVVPLFDQYRVFYRQPSDPERARDFLRERLRRRESIIFAVRERGAAVGFAQLYPMFSSISCTPIWVLNDLYVLPDHRKRGIATRLLERVQAFAGETGATSVLLDTAVDNPAQHLYEAHGWVRDREFLHYEWTRGGGTR